MSARGWRVSIVLACAAIHAAAAPAVAQGIADFAAESGALMTRMGDVVRLAEGPGWLRIPRVVSNVDIEFEYRSAAPGMEALFGFRSWPSYSDAGSPGYFVRLSELDALQPPGKITSAVAGFKPAVLPPSTQPLQGVRTDGWHTVHLRVENTGATVSFDGLATDAAEGLDEFAGYITLRCARGALDVRRLALRVIPPSTAAFAGAHPMSEPGLTMPRLLREVKPFYPIEPLNAAIQGSVHVEFVIGADGVPAAARVSRPVHPDLDEAAMAASRKWRFAPGVRDGVPVPVVAVMELSFKLGEGLRP